MRVDVNIITKDRPTELALLLQSLRTQTYQGFDVYILDDASGTPILNFHFLNVLFQRLKYEGHKVIVLRNNRNMGVSKSRQKIADFCIEHGDGDLILRQDDDTILEPDYLEKCVEGIEQGYDLVSSVTTARTRLRAGFLVLDIM